jgi:hypothetical protein
MKSLPQPKDFKKIYSELKCKPVRGTFFEPNGDCCPLTAFWRKNNDGKLPSSALDIEKWYRDELEMSSVQIKNFYNGFDYHNTIIPCTEFGKLGKEVGEELFSLSN